MVEKFENCVILGPGGGIKLGLSPVLVKAPILAFESDDVELKAEEALLGLTESICEIHRDRGWSLRFLLRCIEWLAGRAIYYRRR